MAHTVVNLHTPATFEIRVPGRLNPAWAEYVDANALSHVDDAEEGSLTVITLRNVDQSALIGLINMLFGWGVPLVGVRHIHDTGQTRE
jgi:hypothetical protein